MSKSGNDAVGGTLASLDDTHLAILIDVAGVVIATHAGTDVDELRLTPTNELAAELTSDAREYGIDLNDSITRQIGRDPNLSRRAAHAILATVDTTSELGSAIGETYEKRRTMLALPDPGTLSALALLVLSVRIKRVKVSKPGIEVDFASLSRGAIEFLRSLTSLS